MPATLSATNVAAPLRPLAETATLFRQECSALDHLVEELFRDVEQLREELVRKATEIEENRKRLAHRGAQLAEQRKETSRVVHLLEEQESRAAESLAEIRALREQSTREREEAQQREAARLAFLEQRLRAAESERDELRHEVNVLQATAASASGSGESLAPLMAELGDLRRQLSETQSQVGEARVELAEAIVQSAAVAVATPASIADPSPALMAELGDLRRQLSETQTQLGDARTELAEAIIQSASAVAAVAVPNPAADPLPTLMAELGDLRRRVSETQDQLTQTHGQLHESQLQLAEAVARAAAAAQAAPSSLASAAGSLDEEVQARLAAFEREKIELEAELELVRTRATELQEVANQQRRELVEQRADVTTELRLLRESVEHRRPTAAESYGAEEEPVAVAAHRREPLESEPDPVVSSVMAQFARLQKDVASRRKKK